MKRFLTTGGKNNNNFKIRKNLMDINNIMRKTDEYKVEIVKMMYNKTNDMTPL